MACRGWPWRACMLLLSIGLLSACAGNGPQRPADAGRGVAARNDSTAPHGERSERGNPPFYDVLGKRYHVLPSSDGYAQRGVASWYGRDFHGLTTSSGEPYNMYAMTAAHTTLPLPTWVEVTNLNNGKRVVVKINDRGPFVDNRLIDLSYSAALALDMIRDGTTRVEVRAVTAPNELSQRDAMAAVSPAPVAQLAATASIASANRMFVQVGAFSERDNAARLVDRLRASGFANPMLVSEADQRRVLHRVRIGPIASSAEFDELNARLRAIGVSGSRLVVVGAP